MRTNADLSSRWPSGGIRPAAISSAVYMEEAFGCLARRPSTQPSVDGMQLTLACIVLWDRFRFRKPTGPVRGWQPCRAGRCTTLGPSAI